MRRLWAATEAVVLGSGGIKTVATATGLSTKTISKGIKELKVPPSTNKLEEGIISSQSHQKIRKAGCGRKSLSEKDQTLQIASSSVSS